MESLMLLHFSINSTVTSRQTRLTISTLHYDNSIHRDLHSGNILYSEYTGNWYISDFGFCGPADKPLE
ncbi:13413_t:CDS:2, partial [Funneliformis geosporum]